VPTWTEHGVLLSVLSGVLALLVAVASGHAGLLAQRRRRWVAGMSAALDGFQGLHSGRVGDYVAWLLVGVAGIAALVGAPLH